MLKITTKRKTLTPWWSWARSPQTYCHLRIDNINLCDTTLLPHQQPVRELCTSSSYNLGWSYLFFLLFSLPPHSLSRLLDLAPFGIQGKLQQTSANFMKVNLHSQDSSRGTWFMLVSVAAGEALEVLTQFSLLMVSPTPWLTRNHMTGSGQRQAVTDQLAWIPISIASLSGLETIGASQPFNKAAVLTLWL